MGSQGAIEYFLKIEGVDGESQAKGHEAWIEVTDWSWSESQSATHAVGGGDGAGRVSMQDFNFHMYHCKASPKLMEACASGQHFGSATLVGRKPTGDHQSVFLTFKYSGVLVSSYSTGGGNGDNKLPVDEIALNFAKIEHEYKEQQATGIMAGGVKGSWDLKLNRRS
jgi:type VI secretion system secreted protein Hcp